MISSYVEPPGEQAPTDCTSCGACCFAAAAGALRYVRVTGDDHERLGDHADDLVVFEGIRAWMRMTAEGRCAALRVATEPPRFTCAVYPLRPSACRDLERGSAECLGELARKRARPHEALVALGRRPYPRTARDD